MNTTAHTSDDMLNAWIDGVATDDERRIIAGHLDACAACQAELDSLLLVKELLSELPEPALPRSFTLSPDHARKPTPIRENTAPSPVLRLLPIVRVLSIAAVLAFLVLGGATAFGPVDDSSNDSTTDTVAGSVTNRSSGASEETDPAPRAIAPGEVVDQGQAATSSNSAMDAMGNGFEQSGQHGSDDRSALETATMSTGIFALLMVSMWILLTQLNRARPVPQQASASRK